MANCSSGPRVVSKAGSAAPETTRLRDAIPGLAFPRAAPGLD